MDPEWWALIGTIMGWFSSAMIYCCTKKCRHSKFDSDCCGIKYSAREDTRRTPSSQPSSPESNV